ncbi:MAG: hypothetical protein RLZZ293_1361, partial [Pseudomonadota bacterium]
MHKTRLWQSLLLVLSSTLLVNCNQYSKPMNKTTQSTTPPAANSQTENSMLRVDIGAEIPTFDSALAADGYTYRVINDLYAGLLDFDQRNRPIAGMATSWEISPNGLDYTFHLRHNLKFSDGSPISASDFVFSWQRLVDPKTGSSYAFLLNDVANAKAIIAGKQAATSLAVTAPDPYTLKVHLAHPSNAFLSYLTVPNVFVVSRKVVEQYGESWTNLSHIVTSGAYQLREHVVNGYILVSKNPQFYQADQVTIDQVKYFPFTDTNASLANYKTGALDTTWQNVPVDQYQQLKQQY